MSALEPPVHQTPSDPDVGPSPEEALFSGDPARQRAALDALVHRFGGRLFALARHLVGDAEAAEELVQESFVRLWQRAIRPPKGARPVEKVYGYLRRVLVNLTMHLHRPDRGRGSAPAEALDPLDLAESGQVEPADGLIRIESADRALAAMDQLPPEQRMVLALRVLEGRSYQELADELGWPIGTVMSRLHRARSAMADMLCDLADEHGDEGPNLKLRRPG